MTDQIRNRIAKIYELVKRGSTEGERRAAQKALDKLIAKYNLEDLDIAGISKKEYAFTYTSILEEKLMIAIMEYFLEERYRETFDSAYKTNWDDKKLRRCKQIRIKLEYLDWVTVDSAYEYFRRHMKSQWNKTCAPIIKRCRKAKTRNTKREELYQPFIIRYLYMSKLVDESRIERTPITSKAEAQRAAAVRGVQGGQYSTQVQTAHMLPEAQRKVKADKHGQINLF